VDMQTVSPTLTIRQPEKCSRAKIVENVLTTQRGADRA
jgi:hypothetical protein